MYNLCRTAKEQLPSRTSSRGWNQGLFIQTMDFRTRTDYEIHWINSSKKRYPGIRNRYARILERVMKIHTENVFNILRGYLNPYFCFRIFSNLLN